MDIHEYQAKEVLSNFGIEIPPVRWPTAPNRRRIAPANWAASGGS